MKILLVTLEPPLERDLAARGNAVRAAHLVRGLEAHGHDVTQVFRAPYDGSPVPDTRMMYRDAPELAQRIERHQPDVILLGYWMLADDLPGDTDIPVVMDFIAPRPLEALYEPAESRDLSLRTLLECLGRADFFLVGNRRQADLIVPYLVQAGLDVRTAIPVGVVPIAGEPACETGKSAPDSRWLLVGGGVEWPWRVQAEYTAAIEQWLRARNNDKGTPAHLLMFGGEYPRIQDAGEHELASLELSEPVHSIALHSYADYTELLAEQGHVGIELAAFNVERYYSQSFRAMEFLRHGLPVVCNDYINLADPVRAYQAGWTCGGPDEIGALLQSILAEPAEYQRRSANALRLVHECFRPEDTVAPLVEYLREPYRMEHLDRAEAFSSAGGGLYRAAGEAEEAAEPVPQASAESAESAGSAQAEGGQAQANAARESLNFNAATGLGRPRLGRLYARIRARIAYPFPLRTLPRHLVAAAEVRLARLLSRPVREAAPGNVVIVTRADLYPTDHGGAVKIIETAKALSRTGRDVAIVTSERHRYWLYRNGRREEHRVPWRVRWAFLPKRFSMALHYARDVPASNAFLYLPLTDNSFLWRTLHVAKRIGANVYQAEFPAYARACRFAQRAHGGCVVVVEHNVEYERIRAQEPSMSEAQYRRLRQLEIEYCNLADAVICVSENDRDKLKSDGVIADRLQVVPHGVDLAGFDAVQPRDIRAESGWSDDARVLVYHGTYEYPPNLQAIRVLATEILPRLRQRGCRPKVLAVGKKPPAQTLHEDIRFTGSVASVAEYLKGADLAVVPLLDGGGTRMKIIDYFACGVPVVSTTKGIEGIPARNGLEAFIDDDWDDLADHIVRLLKDAELHNKLSRAGRRFAERLDWRALAEDYVAVYADVGKRGA